MLQEFQHHIHTRFPFLRNKKLLVAVSGGVDSVVLTHLLYRLKFHITLAHCNFKLRGAESDADEAFVKAWAEKLSVAVHIRSFNVPEYAEAHTLSVQMAARELRYRWFSSLLATLPCDVLLTAHHADDALETFIINLSRGTGLEGLTGIPGQNRNIIRPLLPFSKADLLDYAEKNRLAWREDSSNSTDKYLRNTIRHRIIPELKALHPAFPTNFQKTLGYLSGSSALVQQHIFALKKDLFQKEDDTYKISVARLAVLDPPEPYLYELFKEFGFTGGRDIASILHAPSGKQLFSGTHRLLKDRDYIYIKALSKSIPSPEVTIGENTRLLTAPVSLTIEEVEGITDTVPHILYVDKEKLKFPLTVRKWKKGDYFYPFGMQGRKKVSKFFKDEKYSMFAKEDQWLLCSGDDIVWVVGKRADQRYGISKNTGKILKITVQP